MLAVWPFVQEVADVGLIHICAILIIFKFIRSIV